MLLIIVCSVSMVSGVFSNCDLEPAREQRRAAARAALDEMEGHHGSVAWIDDRLDFTRGGDKRANDARAGQNMDDLKDGISDFIKSGSTRRDNLFASGSRGTG